MASPLSSTCPRKLLMNTIGMSSVPTHETGTWTPGPLLVAIGPPTPHANTASPPRRSSGSPAYVLVPVVGLPTRGRGQLHGARDCRCRMLNKLRDAPAMG